MTQEEVIKLAAEAGFKWPDICETTIEQRLWRFANLIAVAEREKCTGTQEFVTLPREVVKQALEAMLDAAMPAEVLRAALEQPQNHVPDAGNMVPAGWKLVPVEPNEAMHRAAVRTVVHCTGNDDFPPAVYRAMLAAAPQPPAVEQPQANQPAMTPIAQRKLDSLLTEGYTISGYSVYHERKHQHGFVTGAGLVGWWKPEGMEYPQPLGEQEPVAFAIFTEAGNARMWSTLQPHVQKLADAEGLTVTPLYTHPQPKRELMDNEARRIYNEATYHASIAVFMTRMDSEQPDADEKGVSGWLQEAEDRVKHRIIEAAHNIK